MGPECPPVHAAVLAIVSLGRPNSFEEAGDPQQFFGRLDGFTLLKVRQELIGHSQSLGGKAIHTFFEPAAKFGGADLLHRAMISARSALTPCPRPVEEGSAHSTVTLLARFLGLSTSLPRSTAAWYASSCS